MGHNFVGVDRGQPFLLAPSVADWLSTDHLAWFILDAVDFFNLDDFRESYRSDGRGGAAHEPVMMVALLLYVYSAGVVSWRKVEMACQIGAAFRVVAVNLVPGHTTIARFRQTHAEARAGLGA